MKLIIADYEDFNGIPIYSEGCLKYLVKLLTNIFIFHMQVIQTETSNDSCPIRFEQPTKFPGHPGYASCSYFGPLIVLSSQSVNRLIIEQLFHSILGRTYDRSLKVCAVVM